MKRHSGHLLPVVKSMLNRGTVTVYNIAVEGPEVYYAGGVLVHNCPICEPMPFLDDNLKVGPDDPFTTGEGTTVMFPPAHVQCRCGVSWEIRDPNEGRSMRFDGLAKATARLAKEEAA